MNHHKFLERHAFLAQFAYHGATFFGVQEQPGLKTVLGVLRARLVAAAGQEPRSFVVAARTDRGVSASKNFVTFYFRAPFDEAAFLANIRAEYDDGLLALVVKKAPHQMHARANALAKTYRYTIKDGRCRAEQPDDMVWEIAPVLSIEAMQRAARDFVGVHNFSSVRGGGCEAGTATREIVSIAIHRTHASYIFIDITGTGFLRKMVRNMVGLLVEIGAGLRPHNVVADILAARSRAAAGITAPAYGLCLLDIDFKDLDQVR